MAQMPFIDTPYWQRIPTIVIEVENSELYRQVAFCIFIFDNLHTTHYLDNLKTGLQARHPDLPTSILHLASSQHRRGKIGLHIGNKPRYV